MAKRRRASGSKQRNQKKTKKRKNNENELNENHLAIEEEYVSSETEQRTEDGKEEEEKEMETNTRGQKRKNQPKKGQGKEKGSREGDKEKEKEYEKDKEKEKEYIPENEKEKETEDKDIEEGGDSKKPRSKNWTWGDSYRMLQIMKKEGKNWEKVLQLLHNEHRATHIRISDATEKLRAHYNNYNSVKSPFRKPYQAPKLERIKEKEAEFALKQEQRRREHDKAKAWVKKIDAKELCQDSAVRQTEEEIRQKMKEKSEERRAVREQRVELAQQEAESEMQFRKTLATTTEKLGDYLEKAEKTEEAILQYMKMKTAYYERQLQHQVASESEDWVVYFEQCFFV